MIAAGQHVRTEATNVTSPPDATNLVTETVNNAISSSSAHAHVETSGGNFKILSQSGSGTYNLDITNDKLHLKGDVDAKSAGTHQMVSVIPALAQVGSWNYITDTVVPDMFAIMTEIMSGTRTPTDLQNYLIATFTFSRCR